MNLQLVSLTQLAIHDIRRERDPAFIYSYVISILVCSVIQVELIRGWTLLRRKVSDPEKLRLENEELGKMLTFWSSDLNPKELQRGNTLMVKDKIRWTCFQTILVGSQMNSVF